MHPMPSAHAKQQLAQLANRFDHWRQTRTTRDDSLSVVRDRHEVQISLVSL